MNQAPQWSTRKLYTLLSVWFALAAAGQVTYSIDAVRDLAGDYPAKPISLGDPWPSATSVTREATEVGLQRGDRVVAIEGRAVSGTQDLASAVHARHPGDTLRITIEGNGQVTDHAVKLRAVESNRDSAFGWVWAIVACLVFPWFSILLAFWVAFLRPVDARAWMMAGTLMGLSYFPSAPVLGPLGWPPPLGAILNSFREFSFAGWALSMMLFGFYFPVRWRFDRSFPWAKWLLIMPYAVLALQDLVEVTVRPVSYNAGRLLSNLPHANMFLAVLMYVCASLFFVGLSDKHHGHALGPDEKRRLMLLYWGTSAALTPLFLLNIYDLIRFHRGSGEADGLWLVIALLATFFFPVTMAYVIVVQRAMDVRVAIRQGVQYALARRGLRVVQSSVLIATILVTWNLLESHRLSRANNLALIGLSIIVVLRIRDLGERLRRWLDRRFFREAYNAEQILGELSEQVRGILDKESLLETVTRKISESLHVERIAVLLEKDGRFRPALATGYSVPLDIAIPGDAPPGPGTLARLDSQLLLPMSSRKGLVGYISLGPKKSEEPYSSSDTQLLRTVAAQTGLALENSRLSEAIAAEVAQRETLNREIEIAREVQQRLFPQNAPAIPCLEYAGHCRPARGVGGDYYDFLALSNGRLGIAIADISGKGIPAALLMASLQASVRGQSQAADGNVAELMTNVNRLVFEASPSNRYATFFYGQFDPATRKLLYTNGGHNSPMVLRGGAVILLDTGGPVVGLFRAARYEQGEIQLLPRDLLILYTDGVSEAENPAQDEWGEQALIEAARSSSALPPSEMITHILEATDAFAAGAPQHDDMTLVVARVL